MAGFLVPLAWIDFLAGIAMQPIDVPFDELAGLCPELNATSLFEALISARTPRSSRTGPCHDARPGHRNSIAPVARALYATIATTREELRAAGDLVLRRYAWRGYVVDAGTLDCPVPGEATRSAITLIANDASGGTVGTLTLGLDGPHGLLVDKVYGIELDAIRAAGRRVCELTQFAVDLGADSKTVLATLFSLAFSLGRVLHKATDVLIEVNPRHVAYYKRALGFVVEAGERICDRVRAPSVLLRLDTERLEERLRRVGFESIDHRLAGV